MSRITDPNKDPKEDNPLDPNNMHRSPAGSGDSVILPAKKTADRTFHTFMWELVNSLAMINQSLAMFKRLRDGGCSPTIARNAYDAAYNHYINNFKVRWEWELKDDTTYLDFEVSAEGYILSVRVVSSGFSRFKPLQSSSQNFIYPYPSSSIGSSSSNTSSSLSL